MNYIKSISGLTINIAFILLLMYTDFLNSFIEYIPILWVVLIIWSIVFSIRYRNGKIKNEFRFSSNNDDYHKIYPFIIGSMVLVSGICAVIFLDQYLIFSSLIVLNGILLFISGFFFIPQGKLYFKKGEIKIQCGDQKNIIKNENLIKIILQTDKIIFTDKLQSKYTINHLNLNEIEFINISNFINWNFSSQIEIETSF